LQAYWLCFAPKARSNRTDTQSCEHAEAIDGFFAVDQFATFRPHLVLHINMPNMDGFQAAAEMRALERKAARHARRTAGSASDTDSDISSGMESSALDAPGSSTDEGVIPGSKRSYFGIQAPRARILAVTAMSSKAHRRRGLLECGIDKWVTKPAQFAALRDEIKKCKAEMLGQARSSD
jgi:CheY-like chemotaxis protein